jgi:hypothetical protein
MQSDRLVVGLCCITKSQGEGRPWATIGDDLTRAEVVCSTRREVYRTLLAAYGLAGSNSWVGNLVSPRFSPAYLRCVQVIRAGRKDKDKERDEGERETRPPLGIRLR